LGRDVIGSTIAPFVMLVVSAVLAVITARRLGAVRREPSPAAAELVRALRRVPADARATEAKERSSPETWEGRLARAVVDAPNDAERVDSVSEAVGDLAGRYAATTRWKESSSRIVFFAGLAAAAGSFAWGERVGALGAVVVALFGGATVYALGGRLVRDERKQREVADGFVDMLLGPDAPKKRRGRDAY
jgi:hypothetical protein